MPTFTDLLLNSTSFERFSYNFGQVNTFGVAEEWFAIQPNNLVLTSSSSGLEKSG